MAVYIAFISKLNELHIQMHSKNILLIAIDANKYSETKRHLYNYIHLFICVKLINFNRPFLIKISAVLYLSMTFTTVCQFC